MQLTSRLSAPAAASRLIAADGVFLAVMAVFGLTQDILSYAWGAGKFESFLFSDPRAIGFIEAHGLAGLIAVASLVCARHNRLFWHAILGAVHLLLGGCNLLFFAGFVATGETSFAIAVTTVHFGFTTAHLWVLLRAGQAGVR